MPGALFRRPNSMHGVRCVGRSNYSRVCSSVTPTSPFTVLRVYSNDWLGPPFAKLGRLPREFASPTLSRREPVMAQIALKVNGKSCVVDADPSTPLLYVLRDDL